MNQNVYVNRTLNLKKISYIGFDMDHTLIRYNSFNFEALAHRTILKKLVTQKHYPESILTLPFEFDRAIRGLVMDRRKGNVLKLNRYAGIRMSRHGLQPIDYQNQKTLYKSIYIDLSDPNYLAIDTAFSIALGLLFAQLVELKETAEKDRLPTFDVISRDIEECLDEAHRDGTLKDEVKKNLGVYIIKDPDVVRGLERFKRHGKKLFLLTNSNYQYTKLLLDYAINPFLERHKDWSEIFEYVLVGAQKPRFFWDKLPFFKITNPLDGTMMNHESAVTPGIYHGGCASVFTRNLNVSGEDILYIGDHIYGDIVRLKKDCNWRTGLVVEELADEIKKIKLSRPLDNEIAMLMAEKDPFEQEIVQMMTAHKERDAKVDETRYQDLQKRINVIDQKISQLITTHQLSFNRYWGEIMRIGNEESFFASQVERFACVYMSQLKDLLECSPRTYFRSHRRVLAHEVQYEDEI